MKEEEARALDSQELWEEMYPSSHPIELARFRVSKPDASDCHKAYLWYRKWREHEGSPMNLAALAAQVPNDKFVTVRSRCRA